MAAKKGRKSAGEDGSGPGMKFYLVLGTLLLAGVLALWLARGGDEAGQRPQPVAATAVEADPAAGVALGPEDAPVTIMEFVDYQCPHCAQFASLTGKMLRRNFVQTDSARWILYDFPLGTFPNSVSAAVAARCAGDQGRYWAMEEVLFARQQDWGNEGNPTGNFVDYAEELGLDTDNFRQCVEEQRHMEQIMASKRYGEQIGVNSTPTIFVNGEPLPTSQMGYQSLADRIRQAWEQRRADTATVGGP